MEDLPHQAARYLEALYEEATAAGRAFRRMGLPQRRSSNGSFASSGVNLGSACRQRWPLRAGRGLRGKAHPLREPHTRAKG